MKKIIAAALLYSVALVANAAQTWILFGDSIMSEVYPSSVNGPYGKALELTANRVMLQADVNIRNIASPGIALAGTVYSYTNAVALMQQIGGFFNYYNGVIVQAGTNDFGRNVPVAESAGILTAIITEAERLNKKVLVMDPIYRWNESTQNSIGKTLHDYRLAMAVACQAKPATCYWASRTGTIFDNYSPELYSANEVQNGKALHLNAEGHRRYADWLMLKSAEFQLF